MIKGTQSARPINVLQASRNSGLATNRNPVAALLPKQEFQQTLDVALVECRGGLIVRQNRRSMYGAPPASPLQSQRQRPSAAGSGDARPILAVPQRRGKELRIQGRPEPRRYRKEVGQDGFLPLDAMAVVRQPARVGLDPGRQLFRIVRLDHPPYIIGRNELLPFRPAI